MSLSFSIWFLCAFWPSYTPVPHILANFNFSANSLCMAVAKSITVEPAGSVKGSSISGFLPGGLAYIRMIFSCLKNASPSLSIPSSFSADTSTNSNGYLHDFLSASRASGFAMSHFVQIQNALLPRTLPFASVSGVCSSISRLFDSRKSRQKRVLCLI